MFPELTSKKEKIALVAYSQKVYHDFFLISLFLWEKGFKDFYLYEFCQPYFTKMQKNEAHPSKLPHSSSVSTF